MKNTDAVLGGNQTLTSAAVLGGIEGVKHRISQIEEPSKENLIEALQYPEGEEFISQFFQHPDHFKFFVDAVKAGFSPEKRKQRFFWEGFTVSVDSEREFQRLIRATDVYIIFDTSGKCGKVAYPAAYSHDVLCELLFLMLDPESIEGKTIQTKLGINLNMPEPVSSLAKNLVDQILTVKMLIDF